MTKGEKITRIAFAEVGYKESPANSNRTKYGEWFGINGKAWCAMFVCWCYHMAGCDIPKIQAGCKQGFAGVRNALKYYKGKGLVTNEPKLGAFAFFDWNKDGGYDHIEIFNGWKNKDKGVFYSVGGNTSKDNLSNGGEVQSVSRTVSRANVVFVNPPELLD